MVLGSLDPNKVALLAESQVRIHFRSPTLVMLTLSPSEPPPPSPATGSTPVVGLLGCNPSAISMLAAGWGEWDGPWERDAQGRRIRAEGWMIFLLAAPPVDFLAVCLVLAIGWSKSQWEGNRWQERGGRGCWAKGAKGSAGSIWKLLELIVARSNRKLPKPDCGP